MSESEKKSGSSVVLDVMIGRSRTPLTGFAIGSTYNKYLPQRAQRRVKSINE